MAHGFNYICTNAQSVGNKQGDLELLTQEGNDDLTDITGGVNRMTGMY